ncbi:Transcription-repair-coupling factor [Seminavis robusta]|uniref:Transcription-repair-coupling factor n=1 Tax=Seminavis robusta TaxID=568900 RepID=A0A9N8H1W2_9STRA|nr:Transcription-repair-coupling factor [Seminavis robusta]|eukprot:Sro24_g016550.1 Transcription-repair-coupling factor (1126) ;mRNA; f:138030-141685
MWPSQKILRQRHERISLLALLHVLLVVFLSVVSVESFIFPAVPSSGRQYMDTTTATITTTQLASTPEGRPDMDVVFGSAQASKSANGLYEDDVDDDQLERMQRQAKVQALLEEQDVEFKAARKRKQWGKFANITNKEELEPLLQQERKKLEQENKVKLDVAAATGVTMEVLDPIDNMIDTTVYDEGGTIQIRSGSQPLNARWYAEVDEELKQEWDSLVGNDDSEAGEMEDVKVQLNNGKVVSRETMQGVRVGSAGGWSLEVFPGDFVVHRKYGIGRFEKTCLRPKSKLTEAEIKARDARRVEILTQELRKRGKGKGGTTTDVIQGIRATFGTEADTDPISNPQTTVLEISYSDAVVHVPVDRAYRLSRYRSGDSVVKPRLSRARGEAWSRAKARVEENTLELAQDVLALYATRETLQRQPLDPTKEEVVKRFETTFAYTPTPDQQKCFEDVENDMVWRPRPMDRLVCGDVGFGKTEVAIRALFRAVENGKQAALLAPTGVLAAQHYKNILKRLGPETEWNISVALLRGGMGKHTKSGKELRGQINGGDVQLIVGTHALLSNDLKYHNLGLLVIDEEQRFGVKQKERLKLICGGIDVLTLSATPIPRTLQMSLSGIRDTSTIRSPPPMRKPTKTYVQPFSQEVIRDAIKLELERGGQSYYVVPRISMLGEAQKTIQELFPDIRIIQAHGRMSRGGAENNVAEFAEGNYDILLATTVIENGVDIPSVNTIIIQNSQSFGMSTMYQLRGRVGRSDRQAYAYFLHNEESVTEEAFLRLQAMGDLHELGSGFDIANRDLEIRGAGSLLGTEQSGMAAKVGFDLYMRMLKKSIRKLRGLDVPLVPRTNFLVLPEGTSVEVFRIPKKYIPDDKERQEQETKARLAESTAALVKLTNLWKKKYGAIPASVQFQLKTMHLHACTRRLGVDLAGLILDEETGTQDCVLRSPGLRPRHWAKIVELMPNGVAPKGLNVVFPPRFTATGQEEESVGGKKVDLKSLLSDASLSEDNDDDDWDSMDEEDVEAMKDISSAFSVMDMNDVDIEQYPRLVVKNLGQVDARTIDKMLKVLLPLSRVVYEEQERDKERAKNAADLRDKRALLKQRAKVNESLEARRKGYNLSPTEKNTLRSSGNL